MSALAACFEAQPNVSFMSRDDLQLSGLADDGQVGSEAVLRERAGAFLAVLFVHQSCECDRRFLGRCGDHTT